MVAQGAMTGNARDARAAVLADVRRVSRLLGRPPAKGEYLNKGEYTPADVMRATGSRTWREAVDACGARLSLNPAANNKYGARRTRKGRNIYDSAKEADRGAALLLEQHAGLIADLRRQVNIEIYLDGVRVLTYKADFVYREVSSGQIIIEDPKGARTRLYQLKKSMIEGLSPLRIRES